MTKTPLSAGRFYTLLSCAAALVFVANSLHTTQQGVFFREYLPIAKNLITGHGYSMQSGAPTLYPIWGYPLLTAIGASVGSWSIVLAVIQGVLSVVGVTAFYSFFGLERRMWHIPMFIPLFAVCSVRWPDAIVAVLLLLAAHWLRLGIGKKDWRAVTLAGLALGMIFNFRSEYLGLSMVLAAAGFVSVVSGKRSTGRSLIICSIVSIVMLAPWAIYSYCVDGHVRLTATNGGGVLYISLGQLPSNPWNITHADSTAYGVCASAGIADPYSPQGDSLLSARFWQNVRSQPGAYAIKIGHNLLAAATRGVYTGEYATLGLDSAQRDKTLEKLNSATGIGQRAEIVRSLPSEGMMFFVVEKAIQLAFGILFLAMLLWSLWCSWKYRASMAVVIGAILIGYKLMLVALVQYEPRHMNAVYAFVLGIVIADMVKSRRARLQT